MNRLLLRLGLIEDAVSFLGYTMESCTDMTSTKVLKYYGENPDFQSFKQNPKT